MQPGSCPRIEVVKKADRSKMCGGKEQGAYKLNDNHILTSVLSFAFSIVYDIEVDHILRSRSCFVSFSLLFDQQ